MGCFFEELGDISKRVAHCSLHKANCRVPERMDIFAAGFSCKDLSKLSAKFVGKEKKDILQKCLGTSGKTFAQVMGFVNVCKPRVLLMENVDELELILGMQNMNLEWMYECFAKAGYVIGQRTMNSQKFLSPQRRRRIYFLAVHTSSFNLTAAAAQSLVDQILDFVSELEMTEQAAPPVGAFMFAESHP
eukprot:8174287-Pyramimonas_sp.AAC.2